MGRLRLGLLGGVVISLLLLSVVRAAAVTHYVRLAGSPCGVNHLTIQHAINHAADGDTIIVGPGIYSERITVSKNGLTIQSKNGPNRTFIRPLELVPAGVYITGNGNLFEGFTVEDRTNNSAHPHAHRLIFIQGDDNMVAGNILRGRGIVSYADCGILARGGGVGNGVAEFNVIDSNEVFNTVNGILSTSVASNNAAYGTMIFSNYVHDCNQGIYVDRSPDCLVGGNVLTSNGLGLGVRSRETTQGLSSSGTEVVGNIISNNIVGALFVSCSNVTFGGDPEVPNDVTANQIGVLVTYESGNTGVPVINYNNIEGNTEVGLRNTTDETVNAEYNWWGDPGGPGADEDGDGVYGDLVEGNVDYDPWSELPL